MSRLGMWVYDRPEVVKVGPDRDDQAAGRPRTGRWECDRPQVVKVGPGQVGRHMIGPR
jgi:hypothetical protein